MINDFKIIGACHRIPFFEAACQRQLTFRSETARYSAVRTAVGPDAGCYGRLFILPSFMGSLLIRTRRKRNPTENFYHHLSFPRAAERGQRGREREQQFSFCHKVGVPGRPDPLVETLFDSGKPSG